MRELYLLKTCGFYPPFVSRENSELWGSKEIQIYDSVIWLSLILCISVIEIYN
jgi:hypothetical protein